jgi:hypothetical protein
MSELESAMGNVLEALREALVEADSAWAANPPDEDKWYLAMHYLRDTAWAGKEIIHAKRLAEAEAAGLNAFGQPKLTHKVGRAKSKLSPEELDALMKDLGL